MAQFFQIHPTHPQERLIQKAVKILEAGGIIVYPTDSTYAFACHIGEHSALERLRSLRQLSQKHLFTLICRDLSDITRYARVSNWAFRTLKSFTPGPYTFLLKATREVPKRLLNPKRRIIGVRIPDNLITQALLREIGEPIMSSTLLLPGEELPMTEPLIMREKLQHHVDLVIDGGSTGIEPTTVVDMTEDVPKIIRVGKGDPKPFQYE